MLSSSRAITFGSLVIEKKAMQIFIIVDFCVCIFFYVVYYCTVQNYIERFNLAIENMARFKCSWTMPRGSLQWFNLAIENIARFKWFWTMPRCSCKRFNHAIENMVRFKYVQEGLALLKKQFFNHANNQIFFNFRVSPEGPDITIMISLLLVCLQRTVLALHARATQG